jgi:methylmalonyl-CoA/ethylmalonyl-CoA epimerase
MPIASLGQIALPVSNADRAQAFYGDTLGLPLLYRYGDLVFFDLAGVRLLLSAAAEPGEDARIPPSTIQPTPGVCHYFKVENLEQVHAELLEKGVAFIDAPHLIARMPDHELWMVFFSDPDSHTLALMEEKPLG